MALVLAAAWSRLKVMREPSAPAQTTTDKERAEVQRDRRGHRRGARARLASLSVQRVRQLARARLKVTVVRAGVPARDGGAQALARGSRIRGY